MNSIEQFRRELHDRAVSKGCQTLPGVVHGSIAAQGYAFRGKTLGYLVEDEQLTLRVTPDGPSGAVSGAIQHALDPSRSAKQHEAAMMQEIKMNWDSDLQAWLLRKGSNGVLLGIDSRSVFDSENLAQSCVNWLCN